LKLQGQNLSLQSPPLEGEVVNLLKLELRELGFDPGTEVFFSKTTRQAVIEFQKNFGMLNEPNIRLGVVDKLTAARINEEIDKQRSSRVESLVHGYVRQYDGTPLSNTTILAFDRDLRNEELIGRAITDQFGSYEIAYTSEKFRRSEKERADLIVRATNSAGETIASSSTIFNAPSVTNINLVAGGGEYHGPSEYERLFVEIDPLRDGESWDKITEQDDIDFLASETGQNLQHIFLLVKSKKIEKETQLPPEALYGAFREGLPTSLTLLMELHLSTYRDAIERAIRENIIPFRLLDNIEIILERLKQIAIEQVIAESDTKDGERGESSSLGSLLRIALASHKEEQKKVIMERFLALYIKYQDTDNPIGDFWRELKEDPDLQAEAENLQFAFQLPALTWNHMPMINELQRKKRVGELKSIGDLAKIGKDAWTGLIHKRVDSGKEIIGFPSEIQGKDPDEKIKNYADSITRAVEETFPTAAITAGIEREDHIFSLEQRHDLVLFLNKNPDFDLRTSNIEKYLIQRPESVEGIADINGLKLRLRGLQRLSRLSPSYSKIRLLLADGINSSRAVIRMGKNAFVGKYKKLSGGEEDDDDAVDWDIMYDMALQINATSTYLYANFSPHFDGISTPTLPSNSGEKVSEALEVTVPNWETLFGPFDLCACEHCRSVLSPAAYLVDTLKFLQDRQSMVAGMSAKDILFMRRPDLGEIELTCENTNTPLPYVDLVNEVLENAISPLGFGITMSPADPADIESKLILISLDAKAISEALRKIFRENGYPLSDKAFVLIEKKGAHWLIIDSDWSYAFRLATQISESGVSGLLITPFPQTTGNAKELSVNPEHTNIKAYEKLGKVAIYPWQLPFDLWTEQGRIYLEHLGIHRYELMQTFPGLPASERDILIASEFLGLTTKELQILTNNPPLQEQDWEFWNYPSPLTTTGSTWIEDLRNVDVFLKRSGLDYGELNEILKMKYIDPESIMQIDQDPQEDTVTCDTNKLLITNLNSGEVLRRIHQFVRIWRRLGWTMQQLDITISTIKPSQLNNDFIEQLSHFQRLHLDLNAPIITILSWYGLINTTIYDQNGNISEEGSDKPNKSLYDELFQNPAVVQLDPNDPNNFFKLNLSRTELEIFVNPPEAPFPPAPRLTDTRIVPALLGAFSVSESDLSFLIEELLIGDPDADKLNLKNLSTLYRFFSFSQSLGLSIKELVLIKQLSNINPFAEDSLQPVSKETSRDTLRFVEIINKIRSSGFGIEELEYLLHADGPMLLASSVEYDEQIVLILDELRRELQRIHYENAMVVTDPDGELTKKKLIQLKWHDTIITKVISTLKGIVEYEASLDVLPGGVTFDDVEIKDRVSYNEFDKFLRYVGPMSLVERDILKSKSNDQSYQSAIDNLSNSPRLFVLEKMKAFEYGIFFAALDSLPPEVQFTAELRDKIFYDPTEKKLIFIGAMAKIERDTLIGLSVDPEYKDAIETLFNSQNYPNYKPEAKNIFLTELDVSILFDSSLSNFAVERRFNHVLGKLIAYLDYSAKVRIIKQKLSETFKLESKIIHEILMRRINSPVPPADNLPPIKAIEEFLDPNFFGSNLNVKSTEIAFPHQFKALRLLQKIAIILFKFKVRPTQLKWLFDYGPEVGWLDLNLLLDSAVSPITRFEGWGRLYDLFQLRNTLPQGEKTISDLLILSRETAFPDTRNTLLQQLSENTGWKNEDLTLLAGEDGYDFTFLDTQLEVPDTYKDERALKQLRPCFLVMKKLGISAALCISISGATMTPEAALNIKQAAKAKYEPDQWLDIAKPLHDTLREKQRSALVSYLVAHPDPNPIKNQKWKDVYGLYEHFLIDTEMSPCQMTSRIKQADSSIQLFVQRCLMNLENKVVVNEKVDEKWTQWKWMKYYRVWEANRKIFLFPENWIEPQLRDDKSPFFKELENELLQNDITNDTAETALLHYLEKLDETSRLEICGLYHQIQYERPKIPLPGEMQVKQKSKPLVDILHVFGRDKGTPRIYYYRQLIDSLRWTPWKKIELDITGDHLIPIVWNRRLYLFWPVFTEKTPENPPLPDQEEEGKPAIKYWKIQMARSEYKDQKWSPRKVSEEALENQSIVVPGSPYPVVARLEDFYFNIPNEIGLPELTISVFAPGTDNTTIPIKVGEFIFNGCDWTARVNGDPALFPYGTLIQLSNASQQYMGLAAPSGDYSYNVEHNIKSKLQLHTFTKDIYQTSYSELLSARHFIPTFNNIPSLFNVLITHQEPQFTSNQPFFYQDLVKTFFVIPEEGIGRYQSPTKRYQFQAHYHPYVCDFIRRIKSSGIDGLYKREVQELEQEYFHKSDQYSPTSAVKEPYPIDDVDFLYGGPYAICNWESFFHIPLLIADKLSKNQRFEEAQKWFHYIYNPTDISSDLNGPQRYWITKPFVETSASDYLEQQIEKLLESLATGTHDPKIDEQVKEWRENPFNPHLIARLRTTAYQKNVVMKYLDNLIAWGDQLFRRDTLESINEATQLYILVAQILGPRPDIIPARKTAQSETYNTIEPLLDTESETFSDPLVSIEQLVNQPDLQTGSSPNPAPQLDLTTLLFCVPQNDKLLNYWDIIADRLFKIRHCMNIEGIVRQLPLFEPPIEPGLLVRAAAAGVDISSALNDLNAPLPYYRFRVMIQKTKEICTEVMALGTALLSALEKRDAEALALLRSSQEISLMNKIKDVKQRQLDEANENKNSLTAAKTTTAARRDYYHGIAKESFSESLSQYENEYLHDLTVAHSYNSVAQFISVAASIMHGVPNFSVGIAGFSGSPKVDMSFGGSNLGAVLQSVAAANNFFASMYTHAANMESIKGGYERRWQEWKHQEDEAKNVLGQVESQLLAAEILIDISEKEIKNHEHMSESARELDVQMHDKFTNEELYDWMVGQISSIYFQSYQLAYDTAKRAEQAFRFELGLADSNLIQFGYWDSLKKGLLSAERLHLDLKRMELAYMEQNKREYEITKNVSLAMLNPEALIRLKETGECYFDILEPVYDLDNSGQFMRRLKSVSITLPCVTGPFTSVSCRLTLVNNSIRKSTNILPSYSPVDKKYLNSSDPRFANNIGSIQSIVTSNAQNDTGLFELNFSDDRYLPFEGAGAVGRWHIELDKQSNQFDFNTISDVILHIRYTSRDGGEQLKEESKKVIEQILSDASKTPFVRMFSTSHEFPNEWYKFLHPSVGSDHTLILPLSASRFPFLFHDKRIRINKVQFFLLIKDRAVYSGDNAPYNSPEFSPFILHLAPPVLTQLGEPVPITPEPLPLDGNLESDSSFDGLPHVVKDLKDQPKDSWTLDFANQPRKNSWTWLIKTRGDEIDKIVKSLTLPDDSKRLDAETIEDLVILCHYSSPED
jgi:peptidoglycan hydrolase-like protein with peptidoglycan-binding domain